MSITVGMSALSNGSGGRGPSAIRSRSLTRIQAMSAATRTRNIHANGSGNRIHLCTPSNDVDEVQCRFCGLTIVLLAEGDGSQDKVGEGAVRKKNSPQPPHPAAGYDGIIAVHKPTNCTSFDVVAKVRGTIGKYIRDQSPGVPHKQCRVKVGHGGTLDPAATGVLVIGIGKGTKMMDLYTKGSKSYKAVGLFGHETDTGDAEGVNTGDEMGFEHVTQEKLENSLKKFVGNITQVPPQYSAIKKDGVKAYELARKGVEVEMTPRAITIHSISLSRPFAETSPAFEFEVSCGGGTYIRSLVRDIARDLGSAAHMCALVRTKQGEFTLDDCIDADNIFQADKILSAMPGKLGEALDGVQDEAHHEGGGSKSKEE